jgi:hypothetical protein
MAVVKSYDFLSFSNRGQWNKGRRKTHLNNKNTKYVLETIENKYIVQIIDPTH